MSENVAKRITVVDYGMGNLRSITKTLMRIGSNVRVSSETSDIDWAERLVLPGVGAFPEAMRKLSELGLIDSLHENVLQRKKPVLGICLGMELMAKHSVELVPTRGLGWLDARMVAFDRDQGIRVPHVSWNQVWIKRPDPLFKGFENGSFCYFVHSYYMVCDNPVLISATTEYGEDFPSVVSRENIFGTQFHPEKSQSKGAPILINFAAADLETCPSFA